MRLSFSTLRLLHDCPHNYVNKISKIEQPESIYLIEGKEGHRIGQDHVSGKKLHPGMAHIKMVFPIVEEKDFDERLKFEVPYKGHTIIGFCDALDKLIPDSPTRLAEFKFSSSPWSLDKYKKDYQRKMYGWAIRSLKEAILITGQRQPEKWLSQPPKTLKVPFVEQDYVDAEWFIDRGLEIIQSGDFLTDLEDGKCRDPRCYWGERCMFK